MSKIIINFTKAIAIVFKKRYYLILGVLSFIVFFALYAFVLPATYTGGHVGFVSLKFLNFKLGVFAFLFSLALAMIVPFAIYAFRRKDCQKISVTAPKQNLRSATGQAGSFFGSVLPPILCCSPLLPSLAALLGGVFPFAFRVSGFVQGFIATHETQIYIVIVAILAFSVYQNAKQVIRAEHQICDNWVF